jgi:hypothetical protein
VDIPAVRSSLPVGEVMRFANENRQQLNKHNQFVASAAGHILDGAGGLAYPRHDYCLVY